MIWIIFSIFVLSMFASVDWLAHISMNKSQKVKYGWGNYRKFKNEFNKIDWKPGELYPRSLFNYGNKSEFHANIVKFKGKCMIINNPFSLYLCKRYVKKFINKDEVKLNTHKW